MNRVCELPHCPAWGYPADFRSVYDLEVIAPDADVLVADDEGDNGTTLLVTVDSILLKLVAAAVFSSAPSDFSDAIGGDVVTLPIRQSVWRAGNKREGADGGSGMEDLLFPNRFLALASLSFGNDGAGGLPFLGGLTLSFFVGHNVLLQGLMRI